MSQAPQVADPPVVNAMTVDVEDWFQVQAFAHCIPRAGWDGCEQRVEANVDRILALFRCGKGAGDVLHPRLDRRAPSRDGASHRRGRARTGEPRLGAYPRQHAGPGDLPRRRRAHPPDAGGYRRRAGRRLSRGNVLDRQARNQWAFGVLRDAGYAYSSSVNPIRHDLYGMPDAPRMPFQPEGGAAVGNPDDHCRRARPQLALRRGRLFPPAAIRVLSPRPRQGEPAGALGRGFSISIRGRSIPASRALPARAGNRVCGTTPISRTCTQAGTGPAGFCLGPHGPRVRGCHGSPSP